MLKILQLRRAGPFLNHIHSSDVQATSLCLAIFGTLSLRGALHRLSDVAAVFDGKLTT
jgi:hypothetical protein